MKKVKFKDDSNENFYYLISEFNDIDFGEIYVAVFYEKIDLYNNCKKKDEFFYLEYISKNEMVII